MLELLAQVGLDAVLMLDFTPQLRTTSAQEFADRVLCKALHAVEVHEGDNFQFGYHGEGSVSGLQHLGKDLGFLKARGIGNGDFGAPRGGFSGFMSGTLIGLYEWCV